MGRTWEQLYARSISRMDVTCKLKVCRLREGVHAQSNFLVTVSGGSLRLEQEPDSRLL